MKKNYPTSHKYLTGPAKACVLFSAFACASTAGLHAQLLAEDVFVVGGGSEYTADSNLNGQSSDSAVGFSGVWAGANSNFIQPQSDNLTFTGLENAGGSVYLRSSDSGAGVPLSRATSHAYTSVSGAPTLWFASVIQSNTPTDSAGAVLEGMSGFLSDVLPVTASTSSATAALWTDANGGALAGFGWGVSDGLNLSVKYQEDFGGTTSVASADTGLDLTAGTNYLLIGQLSLNTSGNNDSLNIWLRSTMPANQGDLGIADWSVTTANIAQNSDDLDSLTLWGGSDSQSQNNYFDATRVGQNFASVTAIPEASSYGLVFGLFAVVFAVVIRRRRIQR